MTIAPVDKSISLPSYPEYKDTGEDWLEEIPVGWELKRLRFVLRTRPSPSEVKGLASDALVSFLPMEYIRDGTFDNENSKALGDIGSGYTYFAEGDVTVAKITPCFENGKGALMIGLINGVGFGTTELHVLRPDSKLDRRFLYYLTISHPFRSIGSAHMYGTGGQKRVPEEFIRDLRCGIPSIEEQRAIVDFLDNETTKIDKLIAKKERVITLLEERRVALISQVVTKGLNSKTPMMDSGVMWLGKIPSHWKVKRIKHLTSEPLKYGANEAAELQDPNLPRFVRITDIDNQGRLREDTFRSLPEDIARPYLLRQGDFLFARSGATVGKTFLYDESWGRACYAGYLIRARLDLRLVIPKFVAYFTLSSMYWDWVSSIFIQATIQNVSAEKYANLRIAIPPLEEQKDIIRFLDMKTSSIDEIVKKTRIQIDKLREYRTALITMTVTGKIDVRAFQHRNGQEPLQV